MSTSSLFYRDTHTHNQAYKIVLLMLHGNSASGLVWNKVIEEIKKRDQGGNIRCVSVDLRGMGNSQSQSKFNQIKDLSDDIYNFIVNTLKFTIQQIINELVMVGCSLGGAITMQLAVDYPELFRKIVLVGSTGAQGHKVLEEQIVQVGEKQGSNSIRKVVVSSKEQFMKNPKIRSLAIAIRDKNYETHNYIFTKVLISSGRVPPAIDMLEILNETFKQTNYIDVGWALNIFDISDQIHKIQGPVLVYHGALDRVVPVSHAYCNVEQIGKDKCKLVVHPDVSHMPTLELPESVAIEILTFLQ